MKKVTMAAVLALAAIGAQAQIYGEIGYTAVSHDRNSDGSSLKSSPKAIRGLVGYELSENIAIEGIVGLGIGNGSVQVDGQNIAGAKQKIDNMYGLFLTPKVKLADNLEGFVRAGYTNGKGTISYNGQSASSSESGFSYGLGARYTLDKNMSLNVDYMSYLNKTDVKAAGFTVGIGYKF